VTDRILIVARLAAGGAPAVARLFGESDRGSLARDLGVTRRQLFCYHDLYFHYAEFAGDAGTAMAAARERDEFRRLSADLNDYVRPFDPDTWRSPADAMASTFYTWTPENGKERP
jgi:hypothetical protein